MLSALIFDVDGTLADTESTHRHAFNAAFKEAGLDWHWNEPLYARLLAVAGGKERLRYYWNRIAPGEANTSAADETIARLHAIKTRHYEAMIGNGWLCLRPGVRRLIREAHAARIPLAIATTTTFANIDALLRAPLGPDWSTLFAAIADGSTAGPKKPAPDVYLKILEQLAQPADTCIAFEDSENGLRAARTAGIPAIITPTAYTASQCFDDALLVLPHLGDPGEPLPQPLPGAQQCWVDLAALRATQQRTLRRQSSCKSSTARH